MTITIDGDNVLYDRTALDDTDSTYTTKGEEFYTVDTTNGTLTVELSTGDTQAGFHKRFEDVGGNVETNAVTFSTEGSETIDGSASVTWDHNNGSYVDLWSDGTNWFTSLQAAFDALVADSATVSSLTDGSSNTIADFVGHGLSVDGSNVLNSDFEVNTIDSGSTTTYTTSDEDLIVVDTSSAAVTVTLASADATQNNTIEFRLVDGSNGLTIDTEGSETIDPNAASSITITKAGWSKTISSDGTNWDASDAAEFETISATSGTVTSSDKDIPGVPSSSQAGETTLDTWAQASSTRPAFIVARVQAETDGSSNGNVVLEVDESGGTTADYSLQGSYADTSLGAGGRARGSPSTTLPAGAQYRWSNASDPNNNNAVQEAREFIL